MPNTEWHGTGEEGQALNDAIKPYCTCQFGLMDVRTATCPTHTAVLEDQRFLDGLLCSRQMRAKLLADEGVDRA